MPDPLSPDLLDWLLAGDPAIRWQVQRDLLDLSPAEWQAERRLTLSQGWGADLLARQDPDGGWGGGIYSPKWISATYTLLTLRRIGIPPETPAGQRGARLVLDRLLGPALDERFHSRLAGLDRCIVGMLLELAVYFRVEDGRIEAVVENLLEERMPDGAWNCRRNRRPAPVHSSFHTTLNVLDGLRQYLERGGPQHAAALQAEQGALEFMLQHRLFKSHRTGQVIDPNFILFSYPYRWFYDVLRGLEYFALAGTPCDPRMQDAIDLLLHKRRPDGTWPVQHKHSGLVFFDMEKTGRPSRWNTLRALRVLRWWQGAY